MPKFKFEYIWLDGYQPEPNLRSKTKIEEFDVYNETVAVLPVWSFDGSSTRQAEGHSSDCLLKPVSVYKDPQRKDAYLVVAEVLNPDGSPHVSNKRAFLDDNPEFWFGFEREYVLMDGDHPWDI